MTPDAAREAYRSIHDEIAGYLVDVRPKLKSYDAHIVVERVREAVLAAYPTTDDAAVLREVALARFKFFPFKYRKGKGPKA